MATKSPGYFVVGFIALLLSACSAPGVGPSARTPAEQAQEAAAADSDRSEGPVTSRLEFTFAGELRAPEFPSGFEWLNVNRPLSISRDLSGKIVLLDFWTLGCINCIHIIPDLKRLEAEYADSLVVIGVHSAKFQTESETESIRQAVLRYGLEHPVVNDQNMAIWRSYGARAWPTLFLIDPLGRVIGYHAGEGVYDVFQPVIDVMAQEYAAAGLIEERPLELTLESGSLAPTVLSFPGGVLADPDGERLFIADSNHNRVLVSSLKGELQAAIGSGAEGLVDGDFASAAFFTPQGMTLSEDGQILYIADMNNHAIRAADLVNGRVTTIAGTGRQAYQYPEGRPGLQTDLSSPWDVIRVGDQLHIAMAGLHQLWVLDLVEDRVDVFVGSGREGIDDGERLAATLAQPSGLATDGRTLYFTDPEASAIRQVPLNGAGPVRTLVGTGLFDFGDTDGAYPDARLQHALGIAQSGGLLYVSDTYNHKIKIIDPATRFSTSWLGDGTAGWADGQGGAARFSEPSGLTLAGSRLYIADTNNHLIRVADLETGAVETLTLTNLDVARIQVYTADPVAYEPLPAIQAGAGTATLQFQFMVPEGYQFNDYGPFTLRWRTADDSVLSSAGPAPEYIQAGPEFPVSFPVILSAGRTRLYVEATAFYCRTGEEALCLVEDVHLEVPVEVVAQGDGGPLHVQYLLPALDP